MHVRSQIQAAGCPCAMMSCQVRKPTREGQSCHLSSAQSPLINLLQCNRQQVIHAEGDGHVLIWPSM